jgi:hypothetical protein
MALWTPSQITTELWLDANDGATIIESGGSVSEWRDKSGNGYNYIQNTLANRPLTGSRTINALNSIDFDGIASFMSLANGFQADTNAMLFIVIDSDTTTAVKRILNNQVGSSTRFAIFENNSSLSGIKNPSFTTLDIARVFNSSLIGLYDDGNALGLGYNANYIENDIKDGDIATLDTWYLGCYNGSVDFFNGAIAEVIYVKSYDLEHRRLIEGYLSHKWGLAGALPADHPYKSDAPEIDLNVVNLDLNVLSISKDIISLDIVTSLYNQVVIYDSAKQTGSYSKNIWDLQVFDNKIYVGQGNSSNNGIDQNAGPINIYSLDPETGLYTNEFTTSEEQINVFKIITDDLYIPGHDPTGSPTNGNFYVGNTLSAWIKNATIPNATHVYDITYYNNELFVALGVSGSTNKYMAKSSDMGATWITLGIAANMRVYACFEFLGSVYFVGLIYPPGTISIYAELYKYTSGVLTTVNSTKLLPTSLLSSTLFYMLRAGSTISFNGYLVYILGTTYNDHQMKHKYLCKTNDLSVNASLVVFPEENYIPIDVLKRDTELYVIGHVIDGSNYINIIFKTLDLVTWIEVARVINQTFAMSFEELNGDFYLGLGTYESATVLNVPVDTGKIIRLSEGLPLDLDLDSLTIFKSLNTQEINIQNQIVDLNLQNISIQKQLLNFTLNLSDSDVIPLNLELDSVNVLKELKSILFDIEGLVQVKDIKNTLFEFQSRSKENFTFMSRSSKEFIFIARDKKYFMFKKIIDGGLSMHLFTKQEAEILPISIDFNPTLQDNETILLVDIKAYDSSQVDVTLDLIEAYEIENGFVKLIVKNGTDSNKYKITVLITTSDDNKYEEDVFMNVKEI